MDKRDHMTIKRMVHPKKGKWLRFSQAVIDQNMKNQNKLRD